MRRSLGQWRGCWERKERGLGQWRGCWERMERCLGHGRGGWKLVECGLGQWHGCGGYVYCGLEQRCNDCERGARWWGLVRCIWVRAVCGCGRERKCWLLAGHMCGLEMICCMYLLWLRWWQGCGGKSCWHAVTRNVAGIDGCCGMTGPALELVSLGKHVCVCVEWDLNCQCVLRVLRSPVGWA